MTAMKKNYILPSLRLTAMVAESLMAASPENMKVDNSSANSLQQESDFLGKDAGSYNVWSDDWSE